MVDRERLAEFMVANGFATGHGDTVEDLFRELQWQLDELRDVVKMSAGRLLREGEECPRSG